MGRSGVVITGAGGFIGLNLARHLADRGHRLVLVSTRDSAALRAVPGATLHVGRAEGLLDELDLGRSAALVHLASSTNPRVGTVADEVRQLDELARLLERARREPGLQVVLCSSGGTVYRDGAAPHVEDEPLEPRIPYAWGKVAAESLAAFHARAHGLRPIVLRCANVYGPGQSLDKRQGLVAKLLADLRDGATTEVWGDGEEVRDYVYVADVCDLIERLLAADAAGTFNVGSGQGTSVNALIARVEAALGRAPTLRRVPTATQAVRSNVLDSSKVERALGWRATTSLDAGLSATWAHIAGGRA